MVRQKACGGLILAVVVLTACSAGGASSGSGSKAAASASGSSKSGTSSQAHQPIAEIIGDYSFTDREIHQNPLGVVDTEVTFAWNVRLAGTATFTLNGTVEAQGSGSSSAISCTGALSAAPNLSQGDIGRLLSVYLPGDTNIPQTNQVLAYQRSRQPYKGYYLVIAGVPGVDDPNAFVSSNTNPAETDCNTGGITFFAPPPAGSPDRYYSPQSPAFAFFDQAEHSVSQPIWNWKYVGPVDSPPGYTDNVHETICEEISLGPSLPSDSCKS